MRNITLTGGVAPARAYMENLRPHILDGLRTVLRRPPGGQAPATATTPWSVPR
jgi:hypothetical protein